MTTYHIGCIGKDCTICCRIWLPGYEQVRYSLNASPIPPAHIAERLRIPLFCHYRGDATGNLVTCPTCNPQGTPERRVSLKVFHCLLFETCTIDRQVNGISCCSTCNSRAI